MVRAVQIRPRGGRGPGPGATRPTPSPEPTTPDQQVLVQPLENNTGLPRPRGVTQRPAVSLPVRAPKHGAYTPTSGGSSQKLGAHQVPVARRWMHSVQGAPLAASRKKDEMLTRRDTE